MPYREFVDSRKIRWSVWHVAPTRSERRQRTTRRSEERVKSDRRRRSDVRPRRVRVSAPLAGGWLCFESGSEKRRLVPVPPGWQRMSDRGLEELCARAVATVKTVRQYVNQRRPRSGFGLPPVREERMMQRALTERRVR